MSAHHDRAGSATAQHSTVRDPVCGMTVHTAAGKPAHEHGGRVFHFCSQRCHDRFVAAPHTRPYHYSLGLNT